MKKACLYIFVAVLAAAAGAARATTGNVPAPLAQQPQAADPLGIVSAVYQFAMLAAGLLAFGAIVYGGIKYTIAAGNPSGQSDARAWVTDALLGLLLLLGAYLILNTINPALTTLTIPKLGEIAPPRETNASGQQVTCGGNSPGVCPSDQRCELVSGAALTPTANYACRSITGVSGSAACGGDPPDSRFGPCPAGQYCDQGCPSSGCTPQTVRYYCRR